ncbi:uncharacterized protein [Trachinotus anak]|uniref:uncharacterized protein isoform X2 n=1 Tax=Trachinotus anak TaxID=443729 RepID=UPI0039F1803B
MMARAYTVSVDVHPAPQFSVTAADLEGINFSQSHFDFTDGLNDVRDLDGSFTEVLQEIQAAEDSALNQSEAASPPPPALTNITPLAGEERINTPIAPVPAGVWNPAVFHGNIDEILAGDSPVRPRGKSKKKNQQSDSAVRPGLTGRPKAIRLRKNKKQIQQVPQGSDGAQEISDSQPMVSTPLRTLTPPWVVLPSPIRRQTAPVTPVFSCPPRGQKPHTSSSSARVTTTNAIEKAPARPHKQRKIQRVRSTIVRKLFADAINHSPGPIVGRRGTGRTQRGARNQQLETLQMVTQVMHSIISSFTAICEKML